MAKSVKNAKSLATLQKTMADLAAWKLAAAEARKNARETARQDLLNSLNRTDALNGALAPFVSKRLRAVETDLVIATRERDSRTVEATTQSSRAKMVEKALLEEERRQRSKEERKSLMDLIDAHRADPDSSPT